jgi:DNA-binding MarR family transcriptional regulator
MESNNNKMATQWIQEIEQPAALISYIYRTCQKYFAKELAAYHLGWGHFAILMAVNEMDGPSQDSIALSRGFDKTMVAKSVILLEEEGLIRRVTDANDRRIKRLFLTDKGKSVLPELLRVGRTLNSAMLAGFEKNTSAQVLDDLRRIALNVSKV